MSHIRSDKGNCVDQENTFIFVGEISEFDSSFSQKYFCNQFGQDS